jgi:hypothetical protein
MLYLLINQRTDYMEMMFDNLEDAQSWATRMTEKTGDNYDIEEEEMC